MLRWYITKRLALDNMIFIAGTDWQHKQRWAGKEQWLFLYEWSKISWWNWDSKGISAENCSSCCYSRKKSSCSFNEIKTNGNLGTTSSFWWWILKVLIFIFYVSYGPIIVPATLFSYGIWLFITARCHVVSTNKLYVSNWLGFSSIYFPFTSDSVLKSASNDFKKMGQRIFVFIIGGATRSEVKSLLISFVHLESECGSLVLIRPCTGFYLMVSGVLMSASSLSQAHN